ncbi:Kinesin-like protein kif27 [Allomyces arbusculus]|nr:Kinesin-like protein kif27 [Allomyces arbusculus]
MASPNPSPPLHGAGPASSPPYPTAATPDPSSVLADGALGVDARGDLSLNGDPISGAAADAAAIAARDALQPSTRLVPKSIAGSGLSSSSLRLVSASAFGLEQVEETDEDVSLPSTKAPSLLAAAISGSAAYPRAPSLTRSAPGEVLAEAARPMSPPLPVERSPPRRFSESAALLTMIPVPSPPPPPVPAPAPDPVLPEILIHVEQTLPRRAALDSSGGSRAGTPSPPLPSTALSRPPSPRGTATASTPDLLLASAATATAATATAPTPVPVAPAPRMDQYYPSLPGLANAGVPPAPSASTAPSTSALTDQHAASVTSVAGTPPQRAQRTFLGGASALDATHLATLVSSTLLQGSVTAVAPSPSQSQLPVQVSRTSLHETPIAAPSQIAPNNPPETPVPVSPTTNDLARLIGPGTQGRADDVDAERGGESGNGSQMEPTIGCFAVMARAVYQRVWRPFDENVVQTVLAAANDAMVQPDARVWRMWDNMKRTLDLYYLICVPLHMAFVCDYGYAYFFHFCALDVIMLVSVLLDVVRPRYDAFGQLVAERDAKRHLFLSQPIKVAQLFSCIPFDWAVLFYALSTHQPLECHNPQYVLHEHLLNPALATHEELAHAELRHSYHHADIPMLLAVYSALRALRLIQIADSVLWMFDFRFPRIPHAVGRLIKNLLLSIAMAWLNSCVFWALDSHLVDDDRFIAHMLVDKHTQTVPTSFVYRQARNFHSSQRALFFLMRDLEVTEEVLYQSYEMLLSAIVFGSVFGNLAAIVKLFDANSVYSRAEKHRKYKKDFLCRYMVENHFPAELQKRIIDQEELEWVHKAGLDVEELFNSLPKTLRRDVCVHLYFGLINKVPLFKDTDERFKMALAERVTMINVRSKFYVCKVGDLGTELFFIRSGSVEILTADESKVIVTLQSGSFFGEVALLQDARRTATARTVGDTQLCVLRKDDFNAILKDHPDMAAHFERIVQERREADERRKIEAAERAREEALQARRKSVMLMRSASKSSRRKSTARGSGILASLRSRASLGTGSSHATHDAEAAPSHPPPQAHAAVVAPVVAAVSPAPAVVPVGPAAVPVIAAVDPSDDGESEGTGSDEDGVASRHHSGTSLHIPERRSALMLAAGFFARPTMSLMHMMRGNGGGGGTGGGETSGGDRLGV